MNKQSRRNSCSGIFKLLLMITLLFPLVASAATISTVAGNGEGDAYFTDVYNGALATSVAARGVSGIATDAAGNLYYNANTHVVKRDASTGLVTLIAGNGTFGFSGDGGAATNAAIQGLGVTGLGFDLSGNLLIADSYNSRMRAVNLTTGIIVTPWGDPSTNGYVTDMEYDGGGTLFTVDNRYSQIWVTPPDGPTYVFAGLNPASPGFSGDNGPADEARLNHPYGLALDAAGNIYFSDRDNHVIRRIDRITGVITSYAGQGTVSGFGGDGGPASAALLNRPAGIDFDSAGNLYIADSGNARVRRVDASSGIITTVVGNGAVDQYGRFISSGDGGEATNASLRSATNVALDANDNLYIADYHRVRRVSYPDTTPPTGTLTINNGAEFTNSNRLNLTLTCDDSGGSGCTQMRFRTNGGAWTPLKPFSNTDNGNVWSLIQGLNTIGVEFLDALGNRSSEITDSITFDSVSPLGARITSPSDGDTVGTSTPRFTGTAEPFSTVNLSVYNSGWTTIAMVTTDAAGNWSTVIPEQPDGRRSYHAIPTDRAGNVGWEDNIVDVIIDTTAPTAPVINQPAAGSTTQNRTPTISGTAEIVSTITLYDDADILGQFTRDSGWGSSWSFTPTTPLSEGVHNITATATDAVGNVSALSPVTTFTIIVPDHTPPVVTPPADITAAAINSSGTPATNLSVFLDGATAVDDTDGSLPISHDAPAILPLGTTTVTFSATDAAGNTGSATATITVSDLPAPIVPPPASITLAAVDAAGTPLSSAAQFLGDASATDEIDGSLPVSHDAPAILPFGTTTVTFSATDSAGNTGNATATITISDLTAPIVTPPASITLAAVDAAGIPLSNAAQFLGDASATDETDGSLPVSHNAPDPLPLGTTTVTFSATDSAGNRATASASVTVTDQLEPVITAGAGLIVLGDSILNGLDASAAPIQDLLNGASAQDNVDGAVTVTHDAPSFFPYGSTTVTFSAVDAMGNAATHQAVVTVNNPDATGDAAPAASGTGLTIEQSIALGLDPNANTTDVDGDGIADNLEVGDLLNPSDSDGDGVLDLFESGAAANDASYVNGLVTTNGSVDLQSNGQSLAQVTSSATGSGAPSGVDFPYGVISYQSTVATAGDNQTVRLTFSAPLPSQPVLYKVDVAGAYTVIPATQWTQVDGNTIDLTLTDGGSFDLDGVANGVIVDPLAVGNPITEPSPNSGGGGGGAASPWVLLLLLLSLARSRKTLCARRRV